MQGLSKGTTLSVTGLYIGVVYAIGRMLNSCCMNVSKRVMYEELPDQELLADLHAGIYIAREQQDLDTEHHLYMELLEVYRPASDCAAAGDRSRCL